jgi:hypothetical protein
MIGRYILFYGLGGASTIVLQAAKGTPLIAIAIVFFMSLLVIYFDRKDEQG